MVWHVTFTVKDANRKKSVFSVYLPGDHYAALAQVEAWAADFAAALDPLLDGQIAGAQVSRDLDLAGLKAAPDPAADVNAGLLRQYITLPWDAVGGKTVLANLKKPFSHTLATWSEAFTYASFDLKERYPAWWLPEYVAWSNRMTAAETLGHPANPCDSRGVRLLTGGKGTKYVFKRSRGSA